MHFLEITNKSKGGYLQLYFILSLHIEIFPLFEANITNLNLVVEMSQQFPQLKFPMGKVHGSSNMLILADTGAGLILVNLQ